MAQRNPGSKLAPYFLSLSRGSIPIKFDDRFLFSAAYLGYHLKALVGKGSRYRPVEEIVSSP